MLRFKLFCEGDAVDRRFISLPALPLSSTVIIVNHRKFRVLQTFMTESVDHVDLVLEPIPFSLPFVA